MIGKTLAHYEIIEKIGSGGMGDVYRARDTKLDRDVALKVLPPEMSKDPDRLKRFEREAKAVAALKHPNIVTIHSVEHVDGIHFLTMELVDGDTLSKALPRTGFEFERFLDIGIALADAVSAAHAKGIAHRDLKPANVMFDEAGRAKVLDFGLAKLVETAGEPDGATVALDEATGEGRVLGTTAYMSPEQAEGKTVDHRTDIFSLGILLYQMITGRRPFDGETKLSVLSSIVKDTPTPVTDINPSLPQHLGRIIRRCLEKDPARRYQTAQDLRTELEDLRTETHSSAAVPMATSASSAGSNRGRAFGVAAVVVVAAIIAFVVLRGRPRVEAPLPRASAASVAVIPFVSVGGGEEDQYFSDGMTDELINALAKVESLRVPARTTVFTFKGKSMTAQEIGRELGVGHILEGTVRRAGDQLRVSAQLISVADGFDVWSDRYDRKVEDVFEVQEDIARAIVHNLEVELVGDTSAADLVHPSTTSLDAYETYLRGRYVWNKAQSEEEIRTSMDLYEKATESDPNYALAFVGLAEGYDGLSTRYRPPREVMPTAKAMAEKAIAIDESLAEAHVALASVLLVFDWDWEGCERELDRALELNPQSPSALGLRGKLLGARARCEEAIDDVTRAEQLDPLSLPIKSDAGLVYYMCRRNDLCRELADRIFELEPDYSDGHMQLSNALILEGRFAETVIHAQAAADQTGALSDLAWLCAAHALAGDREQATQCLDELLERNEKQYICPYEIASVYVAMGDRDEALKWFERAYEARADCWVWGLVDPLLDDFRPDPRFQELLRLVGHVTD